MSKLAISGYGQLELNNVAFRRDGRIEAQCALDSAFESAPAENGMILAVDKINHKVKYPASGLKDELYAINYSTEHMYDERLPGLKNFKLAPSDGFLPRMGYLAKGDLFTSNTIELGSYASMSAVASALTSGTEIYGGCHTSGRIALATAAPTVGVALRVIKKTSMPDGQEALQFQVINA